MNLQLLCAVGVVSLILGEAPLKAKPWTPPEAKQSLSPLARQFLRKRMERHADDMVRLVIAATLLNRNKVQLFANELATEPRLTRPLPGDVDEDLNSTLPERFFVLQDELRARAQLLATVARGKDNDALATGVGQLLQTCITCHSAFLEKQPQ